MQAEKQYDLNAMVNHILGWPEHQQVKALYIGMRSVYASLTKSATLADKMMQRFEYSEGELDYLIDEL